MKRLGSAIILALLLHAVLLLLNPDWGGKIKPVRLTPQPVSVTMVYKKPDKPKQAVIQKPAVPIEKKIEKKPVKKPEPIEIPKPDETVKKEEPEKKPVEPVMVQEAVEDKKVSEPEAKPDQSEPQIQAEAESFSEPVEAVDVINSQAVIKEATPLYISNPKPEYPQPARKRGYQGVVVLDVLVDVKGRPSDMKVHTSSGHRVLDQAALKTVKRWLFEPGQRGNIPIETRVYVPIRFELN
ncbi:MAG: TonB family protein [Desulfobacterales bacterium]|nr:TonB family protein [Desulfobacterales bacterium]